MVGWLWQCVCLSQSEASYGFYWAIKDTLALPEMQEKAEINAINANMHTWMFLPNVKTVQRFYLVCQDHSLSDHVFDDKSCEISSNISK